jgi:hypothetical protein
MKAKKGLSAIIILATAAIFTTAGILVASDVPDKVTIENEGYKKDKKPAVHLSHTAHSGEYKVDCTDCHHLYEDGKNVWKEGDSVQKCSECHDPNKKQDTTIKLQNAYHKNCKNCHKEVDLASKKAPSKKCTDCHGNG